ncbi:hypothetical protein [Amycolatopsis sp. H20-H5]|uniref:hypothetical protein n=1 Tax=Amycolatopsis sp. H20-H5 TaxID=3046309 RepID=UPI002DBFAD59|nr:hypothetical protein [Amycolatopsis sp. H20-H5]
MTGTNSGIIANIFGWARPSEKDEVDIKKIKTSLVDGPVHQALQDEAVRAFCAPEHYDKAARILRRRNLVLLCGQSTGRTLAGVSLLVGMDLPHLQRLDPARPLRDIFDMKISASTGYLWDDIAASAWSEGLGDRTLTQLERNLREQNSYLVIAYTVDDLSFEVAGAHIVELTAPSTRLVADAHMKALGLSGTTRTELLEKQDLDAVLPDHSRPSRGAKVARVLHEFNQGQLTAEEVGEILYRREDQDVKAWFEKNTDVSIRALAVTIALLEGCPYNTITAAAKRLEDLLSNPENQEIWPYDPPDIFFESRTDRLKRTRAKIRKKLRNVNWNIDPENVTFTRPDWGRRLLLHVWKEHERIRPLLHGWIDAVGEHDLPAWAEGHGDALNRFGQLLADSAEPETLNWVREWARAESRNRQSMAAKTLDGLSQNSSYVPTIKDHLHAWCSPRVRLSLRTTAAIACSGTLGRSHPEFALVQLRRLTKNSEEDLHLLVVKAIRGLLEEPSNRSLILSTLPGWLLTGGATSKDIALRCSLDALALKIEPVAISSKDQTPVRILFTALLENRKMRDQTFTWLRHWTAKGVGKPEIQENISSLLRILVTSPDVILVQRFSFFLRKEMSEDLQKTRRLAIAVQRILKEISDE